MLVLKRPCPVCSAATGELLHHQSFVAPRELNAPDEVDIVACTSCGVGFSDLPAVQEEIDASYRDHSKYADTSLYADDDTAVFEIPTDAPWDLQRLEGTAGWLAGQIGPGSRVLDAGCATGALIGFLQRAGFHDIVGLDPSPQATATAARTYSVPTVTGSFLSPPDDIGTFDLVVLSHVLEHLLEVRRAIEGMWQLAAPGGLVYIEVPDAERYANYLVAPFHDFNTEHINHFSEATLCAAMAQAGFAVETVGRKIVLCSPSDPYPALYGLFRRPIDAAPSPVVSAARDTGLVASLHRYVADSNALLDRMATTIHDAVGNGPVTIWGAGQLSMKLLAGPLADVEVIAVVDTSASKWGMKLGDHEVVGPDHAPEGVPVLVTSLHHLDSIRDAVQDRYPGRPVISLR
jgi:SAM-dependent methyltransferase